MFNKSLIVTLFVGALTNACAQAVGPTEEEETPRPCAIEVVTSEVNELETSAIIRNNGNEACGYSLQFGVVVDELFTEGVYWNGTLAPGQSRRHQQIFSFDSGAVQCTEYSVSLTYCDDNKTVVSSCAP